MKPLKLEVFPLWDAGDGTIYADNKLEPRLPHNVDYLVYFKRLNADELAAEYHQQAAYNAYWNDRATIAAVRRNEDRLATLHRFATLPSYDEETP